MQKKYQHSTFKFKGHILSFLTKMNLKLDSRVYIAVSCGADSMALLYIMNILYRENILKDLIVLHINHGTRPECINEEKMLMDYCEKLEIECRVRRLDMGDNKKSNFEMLARQFRYGFFKENLGEKDTLMTAHHLDDSFEWSFMQQMKSSKYESCLGIPVKHKQTVRPFLCVTKKQIRSLVKRENIPFSQDSSNDNVCYERNYIRKYITPHLEKKYPKYLRHYAFRQNKLALKLGMSLLNTKNYYEKMFKVKTTYGIHFIYNSKFENIFLGDTNLLTKSIEVLATTSRGKLANEVEKLKAAFEANKKGPMNFSGGVKAYMFKGVIMLISSAAYRKIECLDSQFCEEIEKDEQFIKKIDLAGASHTVKSMKYYNDITEIKVTDFLYIGSQFKKRNNAGLKSPSLLFPKTSKCLILHNIWHQNVITCLYTLNKLDSLKARN